MLRGHLNPGDSLNRAEALLDLLITNTDELISDVKTDGSLDCIGHALVELMLLRGQVKCKDSTLNFVSMNLQLFKASVDGIPWETALRFKGEEQSFEDVFLISQELSVHACEKSGKGGKDQHS